MTHFTCSNLNNDLCALKITYNVSIYLEYFALLLI